MYSMRNPGQGHLQEAVPDFHDAGVVVNGAPKPKYTLEQLAEKRLLADLCETISHRFLDFSNALVENCWVCIRCGRIR